MANYENALQAARSLWIASGSVSRGEFNAFARSLDLRDRYAGLQGIGWRSLVTDGQRAEFLARARADRAPGFTIRPAGRREEFAILFPDCPLDNALEIAERLRTAQPEGTCSLGVAQWDGREDVTAVVARADRALYAAKEAGRDRIRADRATAVETAAP